MRKIAVFLTYSYPNRKQFFELLNLLDDYNIYCVEIGIPTKDPYMDGEIIKKANKEIINEVSIEQLQDDIKSIYTKYNFKKVLMGYEESFERYQISTLENYYDGVIVVDSDIYTKNIPLISPDTNVDGLDIRELESLFIYVISGKGKTGSFKTLPKDYIKQIKKLKNRVSTDCFVGFGLKDLNDIEEVIKNGADGAIIGSKFMSIANDLNQVETYLKKITR